MSFLSVTTTVSLILLVAPITSGPLILYAVRATALLLGPGTGRHRRSPRHTGARPLLSRNAW